MTRTDRLRLVVISALLVFVSSSVFAGTVILPVVANGPGLHGSRWRTTLGLHGSLLEGEEPGYLAEGHVWRFYSSGTEPVVDSGPVYGGFSQWLPASFLDVAGIEGIGTLVIEMPGDRQPLAFARIYHEKSPPPGFSLPAVNGQEIPGLRPQDLLQPTEWGGAVGAADPNRYRTNFGWYQHEAGVVTFSVRFRAWDLRTEPVTIWLPSHYHFQSDRFFGEWWLIGSVLEDRFPGIVVAEVESGSGIGYLSIVDNETNEATFRLFQRMSPPLPPECEDTEVDGDDEK